MSDIYYYRTVANTGRGSQMTAVLHEAADEIESLRKRVNEWENIAHGLSIQAGNIAAELAASKQMVKELESLRACADYDANELAKELAALKAGQGEPVAMEAIYAAWHGAGVDIAGGDWSRFAKMLPSIYTTPTIPEGWRIVPEEMLDAVEGFVDRVERGEVRSKTTYEKFKKVLSMLAAAPKPEEQNQLRANIWELPKSEDVK